MPPERGQGRFSGDIKAIFETVLNDVVRRDVISCGRFPVITHITGEPSPAGLLKSRVYLGVAVCKLRVPVS